MKSFGFNLLGTLGMVCLTLSIVLSPAISSADLAVLPGAVITNNCGAPGGTPPNNCTCPAPNAHCLKELGEGGSYTYECAPMVITHPVSEKPACSCWC
jgi:hypothetical protein